MRTHAAAFLAVVFASSLGCAGSGASSPSNPGASSPSSAKTTAAPPAGRDAINGPQLTRAGLPLSAAVRAGDVVFLSGLVGFDLATGQMASGTAAQIEQIFKNATAVLAAAGLDLGRVVKCNVYVTNVADFPLVNEAFTRHFTAPYPARTTVGVAALPSGALVEIEMTAH